MECKILEPTDLANASTLDEDGLNTFVQGVRNLKALEENFVIAYHQGMQALMAQFRSPVVSLSSRMTLRSQITPDSLPLNKPLRHNYSPAQIQEGIQRVNMCNGNITQAATELNMSRRTLNTWWLHPPAKLSTTSTFKSGASGPQPVLCAFIEAQISALIRIGNAEGEETTKSWILNFANELANRDPLGEGWFYRFRHREFLRGRNIRGRTPSDIFQNQETRDCMIKLVEEFWREYLRDRLYYSLDQPDLIIALDEMKMPMEVHSKWIYVIGNAFYFPLFYLVLLF